MRASSPRKPISINKLLTSKPILRNLTTALPQQQSWAAWLRLAVGAELADHVVSVVPRPGELIVFADSAAWGVRLRYALAGLAGDMASRDATISRARVRIQLPTREGRQ